MLCSYFFGYLSLFDKNHGSYKKISLIPKNGRIKFCILYLTTRFSYCRMNLETNRPDSIKSSKLGYMVQLDSHTNIHYSSEFTFFQSDKYGKHTSKREICLTSRLGTFIIKISILIKARFSSMCLGDLFLNSEHGGRKKMMLVRKYGRVMMLSPVFFLFVFGELSIMKKRPESMMLVEIWVLESKMLKHHDAYKKK